MPNTARQQSAYAHVDGVLSIWACDQSLQVSPARVARWRKARLLPEPTMEIARPVDAGPGLRARDYTPEARVDAERVVRFLAAHARRGRPIWHLALLLYAAELPIPHETVVSALSDAFSEQQRVVDAVFVAASPFLNNDQVPGNLSPIFDQSEAIAEWALTGRSVFVREVRHRLRQANRPVTGEDVRAVLIWIFQAILGEAPHLGPDEVDALLFGLGGHGLVEAIRPGITPVLADTTDLVSAVASAAQAGMRPPPTYISEAELAAVRDIASTLYKLAKTLPDELLHHLGGKVFVDLWQPDNPETIALVLTQLLHIHRDEPINLTPWLDVLRAHGWPTH